MELSTQETDTTMKASKYINVSPVGGSDNLWFVSMNYAAIREWFVSNIEVSDVEVYNVSPSFARVSKGIRMAIDSASDLLNEIDGLEGKGRHRHATSIYAHVEEEVRYGSRATPETREKSLFAAKAKVSSINLVPVAYRKLLRIVWRQCESHNENVWSHLRTKFSSRNWNWTLTDEMSKLMQEEQEALAAFEAAVERLEKARAALQSGMSSQLRKFADNKVLPSLPEHYRKALEAQFASGRVAIPETV